MLPSLSKLSSWYFPKCVFSLCSFICIDCCIFINDNANLPHTQTQTHTTSVCYFLTFFALKSPFETTFPGLSTFLSTLLLSLVCLPHSSFNVIKTIPSSLFLPLSQSHSLSHSLSHRCFLSPRNERVIYRDFISSRLKKDLLNVSSSISSANSLFMIVLSPR